MPTLPLITEVATSDVSDTLINESLMHDIASGTPLESQRSTVLVDFAGTCVTRQSVAPALSFVRPWHACGFEPQSTWSTSLRRQQELAGPGAVTRSSLAVTSSCLMSLATYSLF